MESVDEEGKGFTLETERREEGIREGRGKNTDKLEEMRGN